MDKMTEDILDGLAVVVKAIIDVVGLEKIVDAIPEEDRDLLVNLIIKYQ